MRFGRKKKEEQLYQQWAQHSDLPPEAIPQEEAPQDISLPTEKKRRRPPLLYILLWVGIALLCAGLGLLFTHSC
jgi:hypothetical protein